MISIIIIIVVIVPEASVKQTPHPLLKLIKLKGQCHGVGSYMASQPHANQIQDWGESNEIIIIMHQYTMALFKTYT